jgi:septum formation protein
VKRIEKLKNFPYRIILASASPRRQQLLRDMGFDFTVQVLSTDEDNWPGGLSGGEIALHLAEKKAAHFPRRLENDELLVTADTVVWKDGKVYNKPKDFEDAKSMLRSLSGGRHEVFTAVCLKGAKGQQSFVAVSEVYFRHLDDDEIEYYLHSCKPFDKAGSYGIQDWLGYVGIERLDGSFYTVMGLPLRELYEALLNF